MRTLTVTKNTTIAEIIHDAVPDATRDKYGRSYNGVDVTLIYPFRHWASSSPRGNCLGIQFIVLPSDYFTSDRVMRRVMVKDGSIDLDKVAAVFNELRVIAEKREKQREEYRNEAEVYQAKFDALEEHLDIHGNIELIRESGDTFGLKFSNLTAEKVKSLVHAYRTTPDMFEALRNVLNDMHTTFDEEKCDHDVGICFCGVKQHMSQAEMALNKAEGR